VTQPLHNSKSAGVIISASQVTRWSVTHRQSARTSKKLILSDSKKKSRLREILL